MSPAAAPGPLRLVLPGGSKRPLRVLCLGAHSDDIEIGCGGTILALTRARAVDCKWIVCSGTPARKKEAERSAGRMLRDAKRREVVVLGHRDGFFPSGIAAIKEDFERLKGAPDPDIIFTHFRADRHQDHRVVSDLTWNTFRSHLILEYEVPKYDGDLGTPTCYVPITRQVGAAKVKHLMRAFASQRSKRWFTADTFHGMLRLRGIESGAPEGLAEAFHAHKLVLQA